MFVHVVNFWLKEGLTDTEIHNFEKGLESLRQIESLRIFQIGVPAPTERPVIDRSYSYSLLTVFDDLNGHDVYQVHPVHKAFVETFKTYWQKVVIYDSVPK